MGRFLTAFCATLVLGGALARANNPFQPAAHIEGEQFKLPWDGPGAATLNPALLAGTRVFDARTAFYFAIAGKSGSDFYQASARVFAGLSAGVAASLQTGIILEESDIIFEKSTYTPMIAYRLDSLAGSGFTLDLGAALPRHAWVTFGTVKSSAYSLDLGARLLWPNLGRAGRFRTALGVRNLFAGDIGLPPDFRVGYGGLRPNYDLSVLWSGLAGYVDLYSEFNLHEQPEKKVVDFDEGVPFVKSLGMELHPISMLGVKVERTWLETWTAGLDLSIPIRKVFVIGAELDLSHDLFFTAHDQGRGFMWSLALNAGM